MAKFTTIENLRNQAYQSIVGDIPTHGRVELGTKTLDDRDYWENINFNENTCINLVFIFNNQLTYKYTEDL